MKKSLFWLLSLFFFASEFQLLGDPDIRMMAGWHECFADSKKYLSPFEGFVFSKVAERYYQAGNINAKWGTPKTVERKIRVVRSFEDGDANIWLLYYLLNLISKF